MAITITDGVTITGGVSFLGPSSGPPPAGGTQKAIFGYGWNGSTMYSMTNLVSNTGVVATDTTGVGTARQGPAAAGYGGDKAIFGYGSTAGANTTLTSITNLVSNTGVVATDTTGVGTARFSPAAATYGTDKAIFGFGGGTGGPPSAQNVSNLVSNTGVVANDVTITGGAARFQLAATGYGGDKAIFGFSTTGVTTNSSTFLVSNTGVFATVTTGVGTARSGLAAAGYGSSGQAIFGYGTTNSADGGVTSITNLVSNTGVVATDTTGVGTARRGLSAAGYGGDKAIFGYGKGAAGVTSITNLVSNTGVVATDTTGVGTARLDLAAAGYSLT
jgi:hypothetical protein